MTLLLVVRSVSRRYSDCSFCAKTMQSTILQGQLVGLVAQTYKSPIWYNFCVRECLCVSVCVCVPLAIAAWRRRLFLFLCYVPFSTWSFLVVWMHLLQNKWGLPSTSLMIIIIIIITVNRHLVLTRFRCPEPGLEPTLGSKPEASIKHIAICPVATLRSVCSASTSPYW